MLAVVALAKKDCDRAINLRPSPDYQTGIFTTQQLSPPRVLETGRGTAHCLRPVAVSGRGVSYQSNFRANSTLRGGLLPASLL